MRGSLRSRPCKKEKGGVQIGRRNFGRVRDAEGESRWRLIASNGYIGASSDACDKFEVNVGNGMEPWRKDAASATIEDEV